MAFAGPYFDFTWSAREAYRAALDLRFEDSRQLTAKLRREEPDNRAAPFIENYVDFLTVFLNDDPAEFDRLEAARSKRLDELATGPRESPYYLYCRASVMIHWALARGKFGEYLAAINEVKKAFGLLEENEQKFPDFVATKLPLGVMRAMIGTVPSEFRWAIRLFGGMDGTVPSGLADVEKVLAFGRANPDFLFREECLVTYSFLLQQVGNQSEKAYKTLKNGQLRPSESPLHAFALANISMRTGRNDEAIEALENCPTEARFHPFPYRNFMLGLAKLQRLDQDAEPLLRAFLARPNARHYVKEAHQKVAWSRLLAGDEKGYLQEIAFCKTRGADQLEGDKAAEREAKKGEMPNPILLKARLLFDGGYGQKAFETLEKGGFSSKKDRLEQGYRLGRICQLLKKEAEAISFFEKTIADGSAEPWYFACNSALQMGLVFEGQRRWVEARAAFEKCLQIDPDEYSSSLHAKAKAGLGRLKKKG